MFEEFARVYDLLSDDVDYDRWAMDLDRYVQKYGNGGSKIAELGCGTGQIGLRLAKAGYKVTGIDQSPEMLQAAGENVRKAGQKMQFVCQDMRALTLPRPVDVIAVPCDGVNYLIEDGDLSRFLMKCHQNLNPEGLLIFDISSAEKLTKQLAGKTYYDIRDEAALFWKNELDGKLLSMDLTFFVEDAARKYDRFEEIHTQRVYTEEEIESQLQDYELLEKNQMDYNKQGGDDRILFVCRKR